MVSRLVIGIVHTLKENEAVIVTVVRVSVALIANFVRTRVTTGCHWRAWRKPSWLPGMVRSGADLEFGS